MDDSKIFTSQSKMHLSSILGAISTVLLLNPHLALGAYLGSLNTQVSPHQQGTLPSIEAPLSKRADDVPSASSDPAAVEEALVRATSKLDKQILTQWLNYYSNRYSSLGIEIKAILKRAENPNHEGIEMLKAEAFRHAFKYVWELKTPRRPNPSKLTVADVERFSQSLDRKSKEDKTFFGFAPDTPKDVPMKFLTNLFRLFDEEKTNNVFQQFTKALGLWAYTFITEATGIRNVTAENYGEVVANLDTAQKADCNIKALSRRTDNEVIRLYVTFVEKFILSAGDRRKNVYWAVVNWHPEKDTENLRRYLNTVEGNVVIP